MSFPCYLAYKDSGLEWLGKVPAHWKLPPLYLRYEVVLANSPDLKSELVNAIMGALDAHNLMSTQALNSSTVQDGLKDILLNHAGLWEALREKPKC
jgi:hypothetical protein